MQSPADQDFDVTQKKTDLWGKLTKDGVFIPAKLALIPEHLASNALADLNENGTDDKAKDLSTVFSRLESLEKEAAKEFLTEVERALDGKAEVTA